MVDKMGNSLEEVIRERKYQDIKWGEQNHKDEWWLAILVEEVGEVAKALKENRLEDKDYGSVRKEIVQVCAVALAWLECIERNP